MHLLPDLNLLVWQDDALDLTRRAAYCYFNNEHIGNLGERFVEGTHHVFETIVKPYVTQIKVDNKKRLTLIDVKYRFGLIAPGKSEFEEL